VTADTRQRAKRPVGRPRQYAADTEREMIFDAAYASIRDSVDRPVPIADILSAAGVSTRAFYRHFQSKDELLCAMYRRDAVRAAARLVQRMEEATSSTEAVERWIDGILGFMQAEATAERVTVLGTIVANRAEGSEAVARESRELLIAPLRTAVEDGARRGEFTGLDPVADAQMVASVVLSAAGLPGGGASVSSARLSRAAVHSFCFRALTATPKADRR